MMFFKLHSQKVALEEEHSHATPCEKDVLKTNFLPICKGNKPTSCDFGTAKTFEVSLNYYQLQKVLLVQYT